MTLILATIFLLLIARHVRGEQVYPYLGEPTPNVFVTARYVPTRFTVALQKTNPKTLDWVLDMVQQAGYSRSVAEQVIECESGWRTNATHLNSNGTYDKGLWQINDVHGLSDEVRFDPLRSTQYVIKVLLPSKLSWGHWTCYSSGSS